MSNISTSLLKQFAKTVNTNTTAKTDQGLTATVISVNQNGTVTVRAIGSTSTTVATATVSVKAGDSVTVTIKDHNATITANLSDPSASSATVSEQGSQIQTINSNITSINADITSINTTITQYNTEIEQRDTTIQQQNDTIIQQNTTINQQNDTIIQQNTTIEQKDTSIEQLNTTISQQNATIEQQNTDIKQQNTTIDQQNTDIKQQNATIIQQNSTIEEKDSQILIVNSIFTIEDGVIKDLHGIIVDAAEIKFAKIDEASVNILSAAMIEADSLNAKYANVDLANVTDGAIKNAMIDDAAVDTAQIADAAITDAKIKDLTANKITAGTLDVERLIITQDGEKYLIHVNEDQTISYMKLDGNVLEERSVTADKIVANAITANEIASKTITANEILANTITGDEIAGNTITANKMNVNNLAAICAKFGSDDNYYEITSKGLIGYKNSYYKYQLGDVRDVNSYLKNYPVSRMTITQLLIFDSDSNYYDVMALSCFSSIYVDEDYILTVVLDETAYGKSLSDLVGASSIDHYWFWIYYYNTETSTTQHDRTYSLDYASGSDETTGQSVAVSGTEVGYDYIKTSNLEATGGKIGFGGDYLQISGTGLTGYKKHNYIYRLFCLADASSSVKKVSPSDVVIHYIKLNGRTSDCTDLSSISSYVDLYIDDDYVVNLVLDDTSNGESLVTLYGEDSIIAYGCYITWTGNSMTSNIIPGSEYDFLPDSRQCTTSGTEVGYDYIKTNNLIANGGSVAGWIINNESLSYTSASSDYSFDISLYSKDEDDKILYSLKKSVDTNELIDLMTLYRNNLYFEGNDSYTDSSGDSDIIYDYNHTGKYDQNYALFKKTIKKSGAISWTKTGKYGDDGLYFLRDTISTDGATVTKSECLNLDETGIEMTVDGDVVTNIDLANGGATTIADWKTKLSTLSLGSYTTSGFLTNSSKTIQFSIPTGRVLTATSVKSYSFGIVVRQDTYFLICQSSSSTSAATFNVLGVASYSNSGYNNKSKTTNKFACSMTIQGKTNILVQLNLQSGMSGTNNESVSVALTDISFTFNN